jgi:hypothetical protein
MSPFSNSHPLFITAEQSPEYADCSALLTVIGGSFHHHHFWGELFAWVVYKMGNVRHSARKPTAQPTTYNPQPTTHNPQPTTS